MAEKCDLATLETQATPTDYYQVVRLNFDWENDLIKINLAGSGSFRKSFSYSGSQAHSLMISLNKANLSVKSLHRRVLEKLIADGKLDGTVSGTPE